jgi:ABC-2 type transport system ATP-binding protein
MDAVQQFCTKAMLIKDGDVEYVGDTARVASMYREENMNRDEIINHREKNIQSNNIASVNASLNSEPSDRELVFDVAVTVNESIPNAVLAISLTRDSGEIVYRWASNEKMTDKLLMYSGKKVDVKLNIQNIFPSGVFSLNVGLRNKDMSRFYLSADDVLKFEIINTSHNSADAYWKPSESVEIIQ